jgi:hypothetical protein
MTKVFLIVAAFGLAASTAQACEFQRSAQGDKVDQTTVASVAVAQSEPVATEVVVLPPVPAEDFAN